MSELYDLIRSKRAVRSFTSEPLPDDAVRMILNAGRLSGSSKNTQPWHFIAIRDRETLAALATCGTYAGHLAGAAMGVALVTRNPQEKLSIPFDLGQAAQNMMLTAWSLGIGSVMATIYEPEKAIAIVGAPAEYTIPFCISFGWPAPDQARPGIVKGGRRPFDEVVHFEKW